MGWFDKLFGISKQAKKVESDDSYIRSEVIYNTKENFLILLSFTIDYMKDAVEFLSFVNDGTGFAVEYVNSSYESEALEPDNDDYTIKPIIINNKYYILVGSDDNGYRNLFNRSNNLANPFILSIFERIAEYRNGNVYSAITEFIPYNITFINTTTPKFTDHVVTCIDGYGKCWYDDAKTMLERLPDSFNSYSLLKFIKCQLFMPPKIYDHVITVSQLIWMGYSDYNKQIYRDVINDSRFFEPLFKTLIPNPNEDTYKRLIGPKYLLQDDDTIPGDVSDERLDELFRQKYEHTMPTIEHLTTFEDIDEQLADDAESENMRPEDIIPDGEGEF